MELFNFKRQFKLLGKDKAKMIPLGDDLKRALFDTLNFYYCSLNGKDKYYIHLESGNLSLVNFEIINDKFFDYIERYFLTSFDSSQRMYLEALYSSSRSLLLKKSDLRKFCPYYSLWDDTKHQLKMLIDDNYYRQYKRDEVISYLEDNSFDYNKGKYSPQSHTDGFYYKKIGEKDYIVCCYASYNEKTNMYVFDLFRCTYSHLPSLQVNYPIKKPDTLILGVDIAHHKKALDYLLSSPYATRQEVNIKVGNI